MYRYQVKAQVAQHAPCHERLFLRTDVLVRQAACDVMAQQVTTQLSFRPDE